MDCFCEFSENYGKLNIHMECYNGNAMHYTDFVLSEADTLILSNITGNDSCVSLIKFLTKNYSSGMGIIRFLSENNIVPTITEKGFTDTSSDI